MFHKVARLNENVVVRTEIDKTQRNMDLMFANANSDHNYFISTFVVCNCAIYDIGFRVVPDDVLWISRIM